MQITALAVLLLASTSLRVLSLDRTALFHAEENVRLIGHVVKRKQLNSVLSCAQFCLAFYSCVSFNYKSLDADLIKGFCELNDCVPRDRFEHHLTPGPGAIFGLLKSTDKDFTFRFTSLGAKGRLGPTNASGYIGTSLENKVQLQSGIQIWTVPISGTYRIEAVGASGSNGTHNGTKSGWRLGGLGARMEGRFELASGTRLKIVVGQQGLVRQGLGTPMTGGGGGGTFVTLITDIPLIIAGGGGGGADTSPAKGGLDGDPGQSIINGSRYGGSGGNGGLFHTDGSNTVPQSGTGAGLVGAGRAGAILIRSESFIDGSKGGGGPGSDGGGGFGGGGAPLTEPGGGGGYSGGGVVRKLNQIVAGGGGSYNSGSSQNNQSGVNKGDGQVIIRLLL